VEGAAVRIETVMLGPDTEQYAGDGQKYASASEIAAAARRLEDLGFDGVTAPEAGHDPFLPLAIAAEHTSRVVLATNVAIAFPRSPLVTAQVSWDLQHLSGGRFAIGLGTQVKPHNERRYASPWTGPPGPRLREYVLCLKAMFESFQTGAKPSFQGDHYQFSLMPPFFNPGPIAHPHVPIQIAAVNPYMGRLAGELCDGLRLHPIATFRYTREVLLPAIAEGAARAGRKPGDVDLIGAPFLALAKDEQGIEAAKRDLKQHIAFYASTPTYHSVLEFHGWMDVARDLHRLSREGKWKQMPDCISDEMLAEWAIVGTRDQLVEKVAERCRGLFSTVLLDLPGWLRGEDDWLRENVKRLQQL
jgi:probable F420-dependent oxidoreductase